MSTDDRPLSAPRTPPQQENSGRHAGGTSRSRSLWLLNGAVFYILLFSTDQWKRLVPSSWSMFPNTLSTGVQDLSLDFPANAVSPTSTDCRSSPTSS